MNQAERAQAISKLTQMLELAADLMDLLLPPDADEKCPHPLDQIEHEETLDDEVHPYRCARCGATQATPFHINKE